MFRPKVGGEGGQVGAGRKVFGIGSGERDHNGGGHFPFRCSGVVSQRGREARKRPRLKLVRGFWSVAQAQIR